MSYNKVILVGNIGADPEVRESNGGKFATMRLATSEKGYVSKQGVSVPERTDWHNLIVNGGLVQVVEGFVHKGSKLLIEGKLRYRKYTASDNTERWTTEISVTNLELLDPKQTQQPAQAPQPMSVQQQYETVYGPAPSNDPPF